MYGNRTGRRFDETSKERAPKWLRPRELPDHFPSRPPMSRYDPAQPQFQQPATPQTVRQKSKAYASGIVAGVEDVKYQAKYKELKRKVKEIELVSPQHTSHFPHITVGRQDNDKLHYKVLHAKRNIQRMKLERASVYDPSPCRILTMPGI